LLQSDTFQEDLFPDTSAPTPAVSACDWINGRNCNPVLMSMNMGKEPVPLFLLLAGSCLLHSQTVLHIDLFSSTLNMEMIHFSTNVILYLWKHMENYGPEDYAF
jgi:hypothetical protein